MQRITMRSLTRRTIAIAVLAALGAPAFAQSEFVPIAGPAGSTSTRVTAVSVDGSTLVGTATVGGNATAFRWRSSTRSTALGAPPNAGISYGAAVSTDGSVVVGRVVCPACPSGTVPGTTYAYRWTQAGGYEALALSPGGYSEATGVSGDGTVVAGSWSPSRIPPNIQAFRWTSSTGTVGLGFLSGHVASYANGISTDGTTIVGRSSPVIFGPSGQAFRWTQAQGMVGLGFLAGADFSVANAVSGNGGVVAGSSGVLGASEQAFRWTEASGMSGLGTLTGALSSVAHGISSDGSTVVGRAYGGATGDGTAFRWTAPTGMQSVEQWLATAGVALPPGTILGDAVGANQDGSVVVGTSGSGEPSRSWLARVSANGSGLIDDFGAFNESLGTAAFAPLLASTALSTQVLHLRTDPRQEEGACARAFAFGGTYRDGLRLEGIGLGACHRSGAFSLGGSVGHLRARQPGSLGGRSDHQGNYLEGDGSVRLGDRWTVSAALMRSRLSTRTGRNYANGAAVDSSLSSGTTTGSAARVDVEWRAFEGKRVTLTPVVGLELMHADAPARLETGGGFAAVYDAADTTSRNLRAGIRADVDLGPRTLVGASLTAVQRLDNGSESAVGHVVGLSGFHLQTPQSHHNWFDASIDMERAITANTRVGASFGASSSGRDAQTAAEVFVNSTF